MNGAIDPITFSLLYCFCGALSGPKDSMNTLSELTQAHPHRRRRVNVDFARSNPDNPTMNLVTGTGLSIIPIAVAIAVGVFFGFSAILAVFVIVVVASRADPDPTGRRPLAVYLFGVAFFSIFVVLFGTFAMVLGLVQLIGSHPAVTAVSEHPVGDAVVRVVVLGGIIVAVAVLLLLTSLRRALAFPEVAHGQPGPVARVAQSYAASVSFASLVIGAVSLIVFLYEVFRILAPGIFELTGTRVGAARVVIAALYLAFASGAIVAVHARLLPTAGLGPIRLGDGDSGYAGPPSPPPPPPPYGSAL
jgi:hypothetical protein